MQADYQCLDKDGSGSQELKRKGDFCDRPSTTGYARFGRAHGDTWDNAANALAYTRAQVKTGGTAQRKRVTRPANDLTPRS